MKRKLLSIRMILVILLMVLALLMTMGFKAGAIMPRADPAEVLETALWYLGTIFADFRLQAVAVLIFLDLGSGLIRALRTSSFDPAKTANFYKTMVLPYLLGYVLWYVVVKTTVDTAHLGQVGLWIGEGMVDTAWGAFVVTLTDSILGSLKVVYGTFKAPI